MLLLRKVEQQPGCCQNKSEPVISWSGGKVIHQSEEGGRFAQSKANNVGAHESLELLLFYRFLKHLLLIHKRSRHSHEPNAQQSEAKGLIHLARTGYEHGKCK